MKKLLGILCLTIAFVGLIFFRNYQGTTIPVPIIWVIILIGIGALGFFLIVPTSYKKIPDITNKTIQEQLEIFKSTAKRIHLEFDKCEFKNGSYPPGIDPPDALSVSIFVPSSLSPDKDLADGTISSSYIIYTNEEDNLKKRYISQAFPFEETTLKMYVLRKQIDLYVSTRGNEACYFELKE